MDADPTGTDFAAELSRLKRRGSAVLVRDGGDGIGVCTDLLGSEVRRRIRVLVRSAGGAVLPVPPEGATVVDVTPAATRSAAEPATAFDPDSVAARVESTGDVEAMVSTVASEVDRVADRGVEPGQLRVCLGRLDPFLEREPADAVVDAVEELMDRVRDRAAMGHVHLSAEPPDGLERAFDVTVETRTVPSGRHQARWRVHAAGIDTGWLQMHDH